MQRTGKTATRKPLSRASARRGGGSIGEGSGPAAEPPRPYGAVPTARQLRWADLEVYGFLHFTVNTFTGKEWGYGDESPELFAPTAFDPDQIVGTAKAAGMRAIMLTCKHHDGFCLWPSRFTEHSVKNISWKQGKGDVVRDISDACRRHGLKFGVYLSPWDRNHKDYGRPEYIDYYRNQLRELLTNYGPIFEVWFDGANGGDGYYGGARETRKIDNRTYYDWPRTWELVRQLQPDACMFSDGGPDVRVPHAALPPVGHALQVHHFLVIRAVVVHHGQQRNAVVRRRPPHPRRKHEVAVALDRDREPPALLVGQIKFEQVCLILLVGLEFAQPRAHLFRLGVVRLQILFERPFFLVRCVERSGQIGQLLGRVVERGLGGFEKDRELALGVFDLRHTEIESLQINKRTQLLIQRDL